MKWYDKKTGIILEEKDIEDPTVIGLAIGIIIVIFLFFVIMV